MNLFKSEKTQKIFRWLKTIFVLMTIFISLLLVSAPILLILADALLPSALLSASLSFDTLSSHLNNYDFRYSLIDIPLISITRSVIILCVYCLCDGAGRSRGPYLSIATMCSVCSLVFVSLKAAYVISNRRVESSYVGEVEVVLLFVCSLGLAVGHVVVAYRISCRERRKLLIYKIDIEAHARMGILDTKSYSRKKESNDETKEQLFSSGIEKEICTCDPFITSRGRIGRYAARCMVYI